MGRNRYYSGPATENFDGERFHSPGQPPTDRSFRDLWRWRREGQRAQWPAAVRITPVRPPERSEATRVTMVGHATLLIQTGGVNILTDPVWSDRASPVRFAGPKRVTRPGIDFGHLPPIDVVCVSHNHYDHLDLATLRHLQRDHAPLVVTPLGNDAILRRRLRGARIEARDWHQRIEATPDAAITLTPSNHWSARGLRDRRHALWSGFWIEAAGRTVWFAGDTGYGDGAIFRDIRWQHGQPDIALIPIGAYEPRWFMAPQHVAPEESVRIFSDVGARQALGFHWGTFQLTDEPRDEPVALLRVALAEAGIAPDLFRALAPGDVHQDE